MTLDAERGDATLANIRPPVFWGRGGGDDVISTHDVARMSEFLPAHATLVEQVYPDGGHDISAQMVEDALRFIAE